MTSITVTWHAHIDARTCKVCRALDGYQWRFTVGVDKMGDGLIHPVYGVVWNTSQGSQAHGHTGINCRCNISAEIDVSSLLKKVEAIKTEIEQSEQLR